MDKNGPMEKVIRFRFIKALLFVLLISGFHTAFAQNRTQSIQGYVTDKFTGTPLPGVNILITKDSLKLGGFTDARGYFIIRDLPVGTYHVRASYVGYKSFSSDVVLTSGKSENLEILLQEGVNELEAVSIKAYQDKTAPVNNMALMGARSFSPEETDRFAGSYGDPARMVMNYAGVLPVRDNRNDLIIRGNSAYAMQWRLDGVTIPNPNHFGASGTTGGPVTIINSNLIGRSDFFIGEFPAEYGDANAGVFDLRLMAANPDKREMWVELGWNGLEFGSQGPVIKGKKPTYLFSYRHSVADFYYKIKAEDGKSVSYQDMTLKLNFPETKSGTWAITAMGGNSQILLDETQYSESERTFKTYGEIIDNQTGMGVISVSNRLFPTKRLSINSVLAATGYKVLNTVDTFSVPQMQAFLWATENTQEIKYSASSKIHFKINEKSQLVAGALFDFYVLSFHDRQWQGSSYTQFTDTSGATTSMLQLHIGYKIRFNKHFESYLGLHSQSFFLTGSNALEPRFSLKYFIGKRSTLVYGIGLHSQVQPKMLYYVRSETSSGEPFYSNSEMDFTRSLHNAISYDFLINQNHHFKISAYYQHLYDVPVQLTNPAYSTLNFGTEYYVEREANLVNSGTGKNYGIEFTFERFLSKHFFYLFTATVFESNYTSIDGKTRNTAYNGQYAMNAVGGYELVFPKKYVSLNFGLNLTYAGGSPYVPFDVQKTVQSGRVTYDWSHAYEVRREDYKRLSLRIGVKRNYKRVSTEMSFDLQYRGDYTSIYVERIDVTTGEIFDTRNMGFYPMGNFRINF
jgi:hypothetical protein